MFKKNHIIIAVISLLLMVGCSDVTEDKATDKNVVQEHMEDENTVNISNEEQVEQIKVILNSIEWENAKVNMLNPPDYQFKLNSNTEVISYNLWISPNREKIELIMPSNNKYTKLDKNTSAKLFEILTGNQLSETN